MIEIHFLQKLDAVARCGTLSAASQELHISQPALSKSMEKLERMTGVRLFERRKNRIELLDTGRYAATLAAHILEENDDFISQVQAYDRSLRTIFLASCSPVPLFELTPRLQQLYPGMSIRTEVCDSDDRLLTGLREGTYQLIVIRSQPSGEDLCAVPCGHEHLSVSVPRDHPFAARETISFTDLEDVPILQVSDVGFWGPLVHDHIPHPHILLQNSDAVFYEIRAASTLPAFHSDYFNDTQSAKTIGRAIIPFSDPEATADYHLVCQAAMREKFLPLFGHLPAWCTQ